MNVFIKLLGDLDVFHNGKKVALPKSKITRALFAYLLMKPRIHRRESLCELLWNNPEDPRRALRWSLSKIRPLVNTALPDTQAKERLRANRDHVELLIEDIDIDVFRLQRDLMDHPLSIAELKTMAEQLEHPLLEGLNLPEQVGFQQWLSNERKKVHFLRVRVLERLQQHPQLSREERETLVQPLMEAEAAKNKEAGLSSNAAMAALNEASDNDEVKPQCCLSSAAPVRQKIEFCRAADGVRIAYATMGSGTPIIRTPSWLGHIEHDLNAPMMSPLLRDLAEDHRLIRFDQRGCGMSDWRVDDISFDGFVQDLDAVVTATKLDRFVLFGCAQGAATAIAYAARHPQKVSRLILFSAYACGWRASSDPALVRRQEAILTLMESGWGQENPAYRQLFSTTFMPSASCAELRWFNEYQQLTAPPTNAVRLLSAFGDIDVRHHLAQLQVPTLVLHATGDQVVTCASAEKLAATIPGATFTALTSTNHFLLGREPAARDFTRAVRAFLAGDETPDARTKN